MGRRKKTGEIKIKLVGNKIKNIAVLNEEGNKLEEELQEESDRGFSNFVETGGARAPVLENGQETTGQVRQVLERQAGEAQVVERTTAPVTPSGGLVNPEFSVYEAARRGVLTSVGGKRRDYTPRMNAGEDAGRPVSIDRAENVRIASRATGRDIGFVNREMESLQESRGKDYYDSRMKIEEEKKEKKMPWEN